jgi:hypothetical protein
MPNSSLALARASKQFACMVTELAASSYCRLDRCKSIAVAVLRLSTSSSSGSPTPAQRILQFASTRNKYNTTLLSIPIGLLICP